MRARILLGVIACLLLALSDFAAEAVQSAHPNVRELADKSVRELPTKIKSAKDFKDVWREFSNVEAEIKNYRKKEKRQSETDENHLDMLVSSLQEIPREKKFLKTNCDKYKNQILAEYSPFPKENGEFPEAINLCLGVLESLCSK